MPKYTGIIFLVLFGTIVALLCLRQPPLEKYREAHTVDGQLMTIDVCLQKGQDIRKISRALDDAWQQLRDRNKHPGGYAVDEAVKGLRNKGFRQFLINSPDDTVASGLNCNHRAWTIAVKN